MTETSNATLNSPDTLTDETPPRHVEQPFHWRTVFVGALLVAAIGYTALYVDLVVKQMQTGILQFAPGAVGAFFIVYAATRLGRKFGFLRWMNSSDLLILYVMLFVSVFVCTRGLIEKLIPTIAYVNANATSTNNYFHLLFPHLNPSLVVGAPSGPALQPDATNYFMGMGRAQLPWNAWIVPSLCWFGLFAMVILCYLCLASLLRRQWSDVEKLSFPHTVLPLQMFDDATSSKLFRNPLTWIGILIPTVIYTINGFHQSFPTVPEIPLVFNNLTQSLTTPPFDKIQGTSIFLSFAAIGFAYLIPTDLLFSLWFFFILTRVGDVICSSRNIDMPAMPSYPTHAYIGYQAAGAYVALAAIWFYGGRRTYVQAIKDALAFRNSPGDSEELLPGRVAIYGLIAGFAGIVAWSVWAGLSLWFAVAIWAVYLFVTSMVLTRSVAEAGLLMTETSFRPGDVVGLFVAKSSMSPSNLTGLAMLNAVFFRDMRGLFLALFVDSQQMAGAVGMLRRSMLAPIVIAILVAFVVGIATHLQLAYTHGAASGLYSYGAANAGWAFDDATTNMLKNAKPFPDGRQWFIVGIAVASTLAYLRSALVGFPLHPVAYALAPTWTMVVLWFPIFVAWVIKTVVLRYGSAKGYSQFMPFFLGLIVGEFGIVAIWAIAASLFHVMGPTLPLP